MTTRRKLGRSDLEIAPFVLGGNVFGWTADEVTSFALLDRFVEKGFNAIDTADIYSTWTGQPGISETVIGKWLKKTGRRNEVVIATKVGGEFAANKKGLSRSHIIESVEGSLRRLQTDYIDLYQSHFDDPDTPQDETLSAYAELVKAGKVRLIGASNFSADRLADALEVSRKNGLPRYETLQPEYNLSARQEFEAGPQSVCAVNSVSVITYFSLASGFLTGKYRKESDFEGKARSGGAKKHLTERGRRILAALDSTAAKLGAQPSQIALAWLLTRPTVAAPIASATTVAQLDELLASTTLVLDAATLKELDDASA